jgi:hypothetical protein
MKISTFWERESAGFGTAVPQACARFLKDGAAVKNLKIALAPQ